MKIIDAHVHLGKGEKMWLEEDELLRQMDEAGIDYSIVCPQDKFIAVYNRQGNDYLASVIKKYPDRLGAMACANPWFGKDSIDTLKRALDSGFLGLKINSKLNGLHLSDEMYHPLLRICSQYKACVYVHTGTAGLAEPFQAAEIARIFPDLNIIMGHGGASDYYNDTIKAMKMYENLWIESSRNGPANFCHWKVNDLANRVVFGSNAPEYIQRVEIENLKGVFVLDDEREDIFYRTVSKIYRGRIPL